MRKVILVVALLLAASISFVPSISACSWLYEACRDAEGYDERVDQCLDNCENTWGSCTPAGDGWPCGASWQACRNNCYWQEADRECECYQGFCDPYTMCF